MGEDRFACQLAAAKTGHHRYVGAQISAPAHAHGGENSNIVRVGHTGTYQIRNEAYSSTCSPIVDIHIRQSRQIQLKIQLLIFDKGTVRRCPQHGSRSVEYGTTQLVVCKQLVKGGMQGGAGKRGFQNS